MSNVTNETAANPHADKPNDTRLKDFFKDIRKFGAESGTGKDALPKLALRVVRAAADGVIDLELDPDTKKDAAAVIYEQYASAESSKAVHSKDGTKANISKLRQLVKFGVMTTIDPVEVMNEAVQVREKMIEAEEKVKPAYLSFLDIAREQLGTTTQLDSDDLRGIIAKGEAAPKELETILKGLEKTLEGLVSGENRHKIKDTSVEVEDALRAIQGRIKALLITKETIRLREAAAALGLSVA